MRVEFTNGRIDRNFSPEWGDSGIVRIDKIPQLVESLVTQRRSMLKYIELLHDTIDQIREKNAICDMPGCFTAGCGSDHK